MNPLRAATLALVTASLLAACGGSSSSPTPNANPTPTPPAGATPTPTPPPPGATPTPTAPPGGYTFGGASGTNSFAPGANGTITLGAYAPITSATFTFGNNTASSSFSLTITDALNNGDITPAGFPADNAVAGATPIVYFQISNPTSTDGTFGSTTPQIAIVDSAGFGSFASCSFDVYSDNGSGLMWFSPGITAAPSGTTLTLAAKNIAPSTIDFKPGKAYFAISCK
ncbi:MAG: hypothetical protein ACREM8_07055 [Vulcanimicrobiaceae bacterium]